MRGLRKVAALKTASRLNQLSGSHVLTERVLSGTPNFTFDGDGWRIDLGEIAVDDQAILGFKRKVVFVVARQGSLQVDAEYDEFIVAGTAEYLQRIGRSHGG